MPQPVPRAVLPPTRFRRSEKWTMKMSSGVHRRPQNVRCPAEKTSPATVRIDADLATNYCRLADGQWALMGGRWLIYRHVENQLRSAEAQLAAIAEEAESENPPETHSFRVSPAPGGGSRKSLAKVFSFFKGLGARPSPPASGGQRSPDGNSTGPSLPRCSPPNWRTKTRASSDDRFLKLMVLSPLGRSGSTLLQRICNARKKTLIWGEHGGVLWQFAGIYHDLAEMTNTGHVDRERYFAANEDPNQWIAAMNPDLGFAQHAVVESARTLLNTLYGEQAESHDILGFKEIRYGRAEIELLRRCYPEADMLLLVRHPCDTWSSSSKAWPYSLEEWIDFWQAQCQRLCRSVANGPPLSPHPLRGTCGQRGPGYDASQRPGPRYRRAD